MTISKGEISEGEKFKKFIERTEVFIVRLDKLNMLNCSPGGYENQHREFLWFNEKILDSTEVLPLS